MALVEAVSEAKGAPYVFITEEHLEGSSKLDSVDDVAVVVQKIRLTRAVMFRLGRDAPRSTKHSDALGA